MDGDGQPLTALVLGAEVMASAPDANRSLTMTSLFIGPRFGIGRKTFVSLLLSPAYLSVETAVPETRVSDWRLMFAAEVGLTL